MKALQSATWTSGALLLLSLLGFMPQRLAQAQTMVNESAWQAYLSTLAAMSHPMGTEGAESMGLYGNRLGVAYTRVNVPEEAEALMADNIYRRSTSQQSLGVPSFYLTKGLPWGITFGLSYGTLANGRVSLFGAETNVTLYEAPRLPALSVRGGMAQISGLQASSLSSWEIGPVVSWGFWSYATVYAGYGWQQNRGTSRQLPSRDESGALMQAAGADEQVTRHWQQRFYHAGVRLTILPPFMTLSGEYQKNQESPAPTVIMKLGFST